MTPDDFQVGDEVIILHSPYRSIKRGDVARVVRVVERDNAISHVEVMVAFGDTFTRTNTWAFQKGSIAHPRGEWIG